MPVSREIAQNNRVQRERLTNLVRSLDDAGLRTRLPNGWTVAGALGHLAFWDRQRLCLIRRWAAGDVRSGAYDSDVFNDAVQPLLDMIPPAQIAAAAVKAAEEVDALLLDLPDQMIQETLGRPDAPHLNRGEHRAHHLDRIEKALAAPASTARDEKAALLEHDREWAALASEGKDVERILSFWTDDAKVFPPGAPVVDGKQAIREFVTGSLSIPGFRISWEPEEAFVEPGGHMGYTTGKNQLTMPDSAGNLRTESGRGVTVWRREPDGVWRCVIDIWNSGP